jgi:hypothetical protein
MNNDVAAIPHRHFRCLIGIFVEVETPFLVGIYIEQDFSVI